MAVSMESNQTTAKKSKLDADTEQNQIQRPRQRLTGSNLFAPFRTLGLVCSTPTPFVCLPLGKTTFQITTCIGRNLQTYDLKRGLQLVFITSPPTPQPITSITTLEKRVIAAWGNQDHSGIWLFERGRKVGDLISPSPQHGPVLRIFCFGTWVVACYSTRIDVWKSKTLEHYATLHGAYSEAQAFTANICALPTFLNKIFVGKQDGSVQIWNVSTARLVYTILPSSATDGPVTALHPVPSISLLAIAYASAKLVIHHVRIDQPIMMLNAVNDPNLAITSISFRSDGLGAGENGKTDGVMATASARSGDITFWDLNRGGKKAGVLRGAHSPPSVSGDISGGISKIDFLPGQAVLVSAGMDNALKTWIFDDIPFSAIPRVLHSRGGHAAPVSCLHFLPSQSDASDSDGKWLMSSSHDRSFWAWSLRKDAQSTELSQGNIRKKAKKAGILNASLYTSDRGTTLEELKAPRITSMACSLNRDGGFGAAPGATAIWANNTNSKKTSDNGNNTAGWESVVTAHENDKHARTWFWGRKRAGRWKFATSDATTVSTVAISPCGTFAVLGSTGGSIDTYNLQSGIHRQRFPSKRATPLAKIPHQDTGLGKYLRGEGRHTNAITGLVVDSLNKELISSGADGKLKFWDFANGLLRHELDWSLTSIHAMRHHRPSDLIALGCDDGSIRVVDTESRKLVRELWGRQGKIIDFEFSNDGRWIMTASSDSVIRVYDLLTGHLIEALRFRSKLTALAFSSTGEYLATAHEDSVGIHLWTNRTLFAHIPTRSIGPNDISDMDLPESGETAKGLIESLFEEDEMNDVELNTIVSSSCDQLSDDLMTLSLTPKARWQTLLHLNTIRARNKPKEPPKKPQAAPFFLPSLLAHDTTSVISNTELVVQEPQQSSRISKLADPSTASTTAFTSILRTIQPETDPTPLFDQLSSLVPSAADVAIRTLDPTPPLAEPIAFVQALTARLRQRRDYELVQTWMAVFLRYHSTLVVESEQLKAVVLEWKTENEKDSNRIHELAGYVRGVAGWIGGVV